MGSRSFRLALLLTTLAGFVPTQAREHIPSQEQQQQIQMQVNDLIRPFGPAKKKEAIQKLVDVSRDESMASGERYVVLTTLIGLTRDVGDAEQWLETVNRLLDDYEIKRDAEKVRLLEEFLRSAKPGTSLQRIIEEAIEQVELTSEGDRFKAANALLSAASEAIRRAPNETLKATIVTARQGLAAREKEWNEFDAARQKLTSDPANAALNFTVGRWHAVQKRDWSTALPYLEQASDPKWHAAAILESTAPEGASEQAAIGNAWFEIGKNAPVATKTALWAHAQEWYQRAQPNATSTLQKQHLADQLMEIARWNAQAAPPVAVPPGGAVALPLGEWADLLSRMKLPDHGIVGNWHHLPGGGIACEEFQYNSRVMAPAVVTGSFELQCKFVRRTGNEAVGFILPVGNSSCALQLDSWGGTISGLEQVDGKAVKELIGTNASVARPGSLINGKPYDLHVKILQLQDRASLEVFLDKRAIINWQGKTSQLALGGAHCLPIANSIGVIVFNARCEIQELQVKLARGVRGAAAGRGYWLANDWKNPLQEVAAHPSKDIAAKCIDWKGKKYLLSSEKMPLPKALLLAQQVKGRLLTISSEDEEEMLFSHGQNQVYWLAGWHPPKSEWRDERNRLLRHKVNPGPGQPNGVHWEWKAAFYTSPADRGLHDVPANEAYCVCIEWGEE